MTLDAGVCESPGLHPYDPASDYLPPTMVEAIPVEESSTATVPRGEAEGAREVFDNALAAFSSGESTVVIAEVDDGSAAQLVELLPGDATVFSRVACSSFCRAAVGGVADDLDIDEFETGVIVLEEAQWADPTSLGRLQRLVKESPQPFLLIVAHRPLDGVDGWWIDALADAAQTDASLVRIALNASQKPSATRNLDPKDADLVVAASLLTGPLSIPIAASLVGLDETELLGVADALVGEGLLGQSRGGYLSVTTPAAIGVGDARIGYVAERLAKALDDAGGDPAIVGSLRVAAGHPAEAFPLLAQAAFDASDRHALGEAFHLAEAAIEAAVDAGLTDDPRIGKLHLICGRFLRMAGRTEWAGEHLDKATTRLEGLERIEALSFAATVADDGQHPQTAEHIVATAEWEAAKLGDSTLLGSLFAFHARVLNRIGFPDEADAILDKGLRLLDDGAPPIQRYNATLNRAWIHFDRGEAARAEAEFTHLRDEAESLEGQASVADKEAWRARALFPAGHPSEAIAAISAAESLAAAEGVEAPVFLAELALTDGNLTYGRYEEALAAAERVLDLVEHQLPAWENMARSHRASAYLKLGRLDEAQAEIAKALEVSPPGANGWRWRLRCQALQMEIATAAGQRWPEPEAEDLADLMLQSRLYGWAAELLCAIAENGRRKGAAAEAMGLAIHAGLPMVAARAATAGSLWDDPSAAPAIMGIRAIDRVIPAGWADTWRALPQVSQGLAAPEPTDDADMEAATAAMEDALLRAGLAGAEVVLSPAQRRSQGLVRRPSRFHPLRLLAATLGIVVVAGGTALGVAQLTREDPPPVVTTAPEVTVTVPLALEETEIPVPADVDFFFGTAEHRGDQGRSGFVETNGVREVAGYYWKLETAGAINAAPVAFGKEVYVGTTEGTFYALDQTTGDERWTMTPEGPISTAPALGQASVSEGLTSRSAMMIVVVDDAGIVRGHDAARDVASTWQVQLGSRIRSSPVVVNGLAIVATTEGFIHALDLVDGTEVWSYPEGDVGIGSVSADLAYSDDVLYVGTQEGMLYLLDVSSAAPTLICEYDAGDGIVANPMVVDGVVYVPTQGHNIWTLPAGSCDGPPPGRMPFYVTDTPVDIAPAIVGDVMYLPDGRYLYARNLAENTDHWTPGSVAADRPISTPPVVANDSVYFASEDGVVHAVDATTGDVLWQWRTGLHVRGSPAVVDGVVFVASGDGFVYAIGG